MYIYIHVIISVRNIAFSPHQLERHVFERIRIPRKPEPQVRQTHGGRSPSLSLPPSLTLSLSLPLPLPICAACISLIRMHSCMNLCMHVIYLYLCLYLYQYQYLYLCLYLYTYYTYIYVCMYVCMYVCIYIYIYVSTQWYTCGAEATAHQPPLPAREEGLLLLRGSTPFSF